MAARLSPPASTWKAPLIIALAVAAVDQTSKLIVTRMLETAPPGADIDLVGSWLAIELVRNRGAAFGILRGQSGILSLFAFCVLVGVLAYYRRSRARSRWLIAGVGLVAGGAVGNLVDRFRFGYVVDFLAVGPWPTFNLADAAISTGVALVACHAIFGERSDVASDPARVAAPPAPRGPNVSVDG
jgi:signal peptidase II